MIGIDLDKADSGLHDDLRIVAHTSVRGLSHHVLRTDVAGMPLEWIDYKEAARLYHQNQVAYTCGSLLYQLLWRHERHYGPTHGVGCQLDRGDHWPHG